jgi:hypothetical protein
MVASSPVVLSDGTAVGWKENWTLEADEGRACRTDDPP